MSEQGQTPRTDGVARMAVGPYREKAILEFCRQLETELATLQAKLARTEKELERRRIGPSGCACRFDDDDNIVKWCGAHVEWRDRANLAEAKLAEVERALEDARTIKYLPPDDTTDDPPPFI